MTARLKLPPYGRALLDRRALRHHPKLIYVLYADRWYDRPTDAPCLCVRSDYTHRVYDWSVVAGVPVQVLWRQGFRIRRLVAELAAYAPIVSVTTPDRRRFLSADTFFAAYGQRRRHPLWTREAESDYLERQQRYYDAVLENLTQEAPYGGRNTA